MPSLFYLFHARSPDKGTGWPLPPLPHVWVRRDDPMIKLLPSVHCPVSLLTRITSRGCSAHIAPVPRGQRSSCTETARRAACVTRLADVQFVVHRVDTSEQTRMRTRTGWLKTARRCELKKMDGYRNSDCPYLHTNHWNLREISTNSD